MKKVKGIVLESTDRDIILLTAEGEYRRLPARGRFYPAGAEAEIPLPLLPAKLPAFAAAAVILLVMALTLLWQFGPARPIAYLALDINPSLLLVLNKEAVVLDTEALNAEAALLDEKLKLKGLPAAAALELILKEARAQGYLATERENVVLLSLAAPPGYSISEEVLQQAAAQQLFILEVDAYLKTNTTTPEAAREARQKKVSLNALLLAEELAAMDLLPLADSEKRLTATEEHGIVTVRNLLEQVLPKKVFTEKEFIPGDKSRREEKNPGPPEFIPPGKDKDPGLPGFTPPGRGTDKEPVKKHSEVNQDNRDKKQPPQGRPVGEGTVDNSIPGENAPGQQKKVGETLPTGDAEQSAGDHRPGPPEEKGAGSPSKEGENPGEKVPDSTTKKKNQQRLPGKPGPVDTPANTDRDKEDNNPGNKPNNSIEDNTGANRGNKPQPE
ncbi:MAG: hypothetical protein AB1796_04885 [Bacillota bacterium]